MGQPIRCATAQEATNLVRQCLRGNGEVIPGPHFREELKNEGLDIVDAYMVLRSGTIYNPPEVDVRFGEEKWTIEGYEPDGKWLAIVFCLKTLRRAFLITVYSVKARSRK